MNNRILVISNSSFSSGAENSLSEMVGKLGEKYKFVMALSSKSGLSISGIFDIYYLPFIWFHKTSNPFKLLLFVWNILKCSISLCRIIKKHRIGVIYANTSKANIYAIIVKIFTGKKIVWHVRDNLKLTPLNRLFIRYSDVIVTVSEHIAEQVDSNCGKVHVIYGGVDTKQWSPEMKPDFSLREELGLTEETLIVAQVGQLTRWKNHSDFIKAANIIGKEHSNVHFLLIGSDLSEREADYRKELEELVTDECISFLGHRKDIEKVLVQIDILVHPSINEPFGRVLVEAMALKKPVVAYNCGGPKEIITDGKTGYLVEQYNFKELAVRILYLMEKETIRAEMGEIARRKVIKEFNINKNIKGMEKLFTDNIFCKKNIQKTNM